MQKEGVFWMQKEICVRKGTEQPVASDLGERGSQQRVQSQSEYQTCPVFEWSKQVQFTKVWYSSQDVKTGRECSVLRSRFSKIPFKYRAVFQI